MEKIWIVVGLSLLACGPRTYANDSVCLIEDLRTLLLHTEASPSPLSVSFDVLPVNLSKLGQDIEHEVGQSLGSLTNMEQVKAVEPPFVQGYLSHLLATLEINSWARENGVSIGFGRETGLANPDMRLGGSAMEYKSHSPLRDFEIYVDSQTGNLWFRQAHVRLDQLHSRTGHGDVLGWIERKIGATLFKDINISAKQLRHRRSVNEHVITKSGRDPMESIYEGLSRRERSGILWIDFDLIPLEKVLNREDLIAIFGEGLRKAFKELELQPSFNLSGIGGIAIRLHLTSNSKASIPTWLFARGENTEFTDKPEAVYESLGPIFRFFTSKGISEQEQSLAEIYPGPPLSLTQKLVSSLPNKTVQGLKPNLGPHVEAFRVQHSETGQKADLFFLDLKVHPSKGTFEKHGKFRHYIENLIAFSDSDVSASRDSFLVINFTPPEDSGVLVELYPEFSTYLNGEFLKSTLARNRGWALVYNGKYLAGSVPPESNELTKSLQGQINLLRL